MLRLLPVRRLVPLFVHLPTHPLRHGHSGPGGAAAVVPPRVSQPTARAQNSFVTVATRCERRLLGRRDRRIMRPSEIIDILKGCMILGCYFLVSYLDMAKLYHIIKTQSVIKLYLIFNMLEVRPSVPIVCSTDDTNGFHWFVIGPNRSATDCCPCSARTSWTCSIGRPRRTRSASASITAPYCTSFSPSPTSVRPFLFSSAATIFLWFHRPEAFLVRSTIDNLAYWHWNRTCNGFTNQSQLALVWTGFYVA